MAYLLSSSTIKAPQKITEENSTQVSQQRTLSGAVVRDYFGSNKKVWILQYRNTKKTDYDTIDTIYQAHLSSGDTKTWEVTETNYTIAETNVHIDLQARRFRHGGEDYISDFDLILVEA